VIDPKGAQGVTLEEDGVQEPHRLEAVRWRLVTTGGYPTRFAVLATDRLRQRVVNGLDTSPDPEDFLLGGHEPSEAKERRWGRHSHAHWLWTEAEGRIEDLALWVPAGLNPRQVRRVAAVADLPRYENEPRGYLGGELELRGMGPAARVLHDIGAGLLSTVWASATPVLTSWHFKDDEDREEQLLRYVTRELTHRLGPEAPGVVAFEATEDRSYFTRRWDRAFPSHTAFRVLLQLSSPLVGPLCLGALSHFGFGRLEPQ